MTKKDALKILIESSKRDILGAGLGYRTTTDEWRDKVREAIKKIHPSIYGYQINDFNLH